jgi:hypothetical protein
MPLAARIDVLLRTIGQAGMKILSMTMKEHQEMNLLLPELECLIKIKQCLRRSREPHL